MTIYYAPILKAKAGEFKAVKELAGTARQRLAPLFDFDLPDENKGIAAVDHLRKAVKSLQKCNPPAVIFADAFHWLPDAQVETGEHVITFLISTMRAEGLSPTPTIGYDRWVSADYRLAIQNVGPGPGGRYAIRLDRSALEDMYDPDQVVDVLEDILTTVNARRCGQSGFPNQLIADSRLFFAESSFGSWFDVRCRVGLFLAVRGGDGAETGTTAARSSAGAGRRVLDSPNGHSLA